MRFVACVVTFAAVHANADTLWVSPATGSATIQLNNVKITRVDGGKIFFTTPTSSESYRDLGLVIHMTIDDEPALNAAETAYIGSLFDKATDEYLRFQRSTSKQWLKSYSSPRLSASAAKAGRFDAAVSAYIDLVLTSPKVAQENRPVVDTVSPPKPGIISAALADLEKAIATPGLSVSQKQPLLQLQLDLFRARGDSAKAAKTLEQLMANSAGPSGSTGPDADQVAQAANALADVRLSQASVALDTKDFAKVIAVIEQYKTAFTSPVQQAEALFLVAQARDGLAQGSKDKTLQQDAAIAYLRVVAHFKDIPAASARVPASLLGAGRILEKLGDPKAARGLYQDLAEFPTASEELRSAGREGLARLK